ncbi:STAS domain-containing protein [Streptomyces sp. L7]
MTAEADERDSPAANSCALRRARTAPSRWSRSRGDRHGDRRSGRRAPGRAATAVAEPDVLVDLRPVEFLDCSGLRVLCWAEGRARERGGRLRIVLRRAAHRPAVARLGLLGRFPPLRAMPSGTEKPQ